MSSHGLMRPPQTVEADREEILKLLQRAFDCFNAGDLVGFRDTWTTPVVAIINEAPPFVWSGQDAVESWLQASARQGAARGITEPFIQLDDCLKLEVAEDRAHVVLHVTVSFHAPGGAGRRSGWQISSLVRTPQGWRVAALAYGGPSAV